MNTDHSDKQQVSIEQMNEVIALFCGWKKYKSGEWYKPRQKVSLDFQFPRFKYHSSWDEIHKAWDRAHAWYCDNVNTSYAVDFSKQDFIGRIALAMITGNITEAHRILYESIQWINKQNDNGK